MTAAKRVPIEPFDLVSRGRFEIHGKPVVHLSTNRYHDEWEMTTRRWDPRTSILAHLEERAEQLQFIIDTTGSVSARPAQGAEASALYDAASQFTGSFPAYLTSMLVMFVTAAVSRPRLPSVLSLEARLERLEQAILEASPHEVEAKPRPINWTRLERALAGAATALGWQSSWTLDREEKQVVVRVVGVDYGRLARQRLDFYERIASAVDKDTFNAVSFTLEPVE